MGVKLGLFTLQKEHRVRMFEKKGAEEHIWAWKEVTGDWRKLCNVDLRDLYSSPNIMITKLKRMG